MIRRLFRTLAGWCWAMYLVALIVWVVALVASFGVGLSATLSLGHFNSCNLGDGDLECIVRDERQSTFTLLPDPPSTRIAFPGFESTWDPAGREYSVPGFSLWQSYNLKLSGWLVTTALIIPLVVAMILHRRRQRTAPPSDAGPRSRSAVGQVAGLLFALTNALSLWIIAAAVALLCLTPVDRARAGNVSMVTSGLTTAVLYAGTDEGRFTLDAAEIDAPEEAAIWSLFQGLGPDSYSLVKDADLPLWQPVALLAVLPFVSLIVGLRRAPFPPGCCRACGYDLRGSPASAGDANGPAKCPECGWSGAA